MWLIDIPLCRRCGAEEETSAHVVCECKASATLRHTSLDSFFFDPQDVRTLHLGGNLERN
jgi:ribosomal protein L40E